MKKTRRSILAAVMAFALLLGLMPALTPSAEAAGTGGIAIMGDMDGVSYSPKLLLGKTGTVIVKLQNGSGATRYNIDIVLTPPTGVSTGTVTGGTSGTTLLSSPAVDTKTNTITYRYAQLKSLDVSRTAELTAFADASGVSAWASDALRWATGAGLINGSDGRLLPQNGAQRAQVAAILQRFIRNIAK